MDYETYPHNGELKLEPLSTCIDCHGGDDAYASFQFDKINDEFQKSIHFEISGDRFTCSKCHNQHYYKATARTSDNVKDIVDYSNNMCISCHNNMSKYQLVSEHENPRLIQVHEWLPNQALHFEHVRCIECHTVVVDSLNISHNIQGRENAEKLCVECHSKNSILQASLYKYQNLQARSENGNFNTILSNESYVIGAYQNSRLNLLSFLIFLSTIAGISVHILFRILKKK
jgi:RNase P subunit RPR2